MNNMEMLTEIRNNSSRQTETLSNLNGLGLKDAKAVHLLWLYPDITNIHGGRGDIMAFMHIANMMELPLEIRRCDSLQETVDWSWPDIVYITAGELKCAREIADALRTQMGDEASGLLAYINNGGYFIANGSSGAALADKIYLDYSGQKEEVEGLGLLHMTWKQRDMVWGDDIWVTTDDGIDILGNQIQIADVELAEGQKAFATLQYGRGNNGITEDKLGVGSSTLVGKGSGLEGARTGNVIYTCVLGPMCTKNPRFTESILKGAAEHAGVKAGAELKDEDIQFELESIECLKRFIRIKQEDPNTLADILKNNNR